MRYTQKWTGFCEKNGKIGEGFSAIVPGNIQLDYAKAHNFPDVNWSDTCTKFKELEDCGWIYRTEIKYEKQENERVYFVTEGIEYEYDIILNSKILLHHVGMFTKVELEITDGLKDGNILEIYIYPHPKREGADECRDQADQSCKPAVEYGWDWHPRLLVSGLWNETYIETRNVGTIVSCSHSYELSENLDCAVVTFDVKCDRETIIEVTDMEGNIVYKGTDKKFTIENINLWWCNGQGLPYLYNWKISNDLDSKTGKIGFRKVTLEMNGTDAWENPRKFPKSRSNPPITICLNGRNIFAKGSNWVNPEMFTGSITRERYEELLILARDANMNILRCWGGAIVNKEAFFELCDELGLLIWQEFPLACNNYIGTKEYLEILEQEAISIIQRVNQHACLALWCGGNELFNGWSRMTEQSPALRLLNKLCYEHDPKTPFIMTAPIMGMAHGHYIFYDIKENLTCFEIFQNSSNTAYSEFGASSITERKYLEQIFSEEEMKSPLPGTVWELHHGYNAWGPNRWLCFDEIDAFFGKQKSFDDYIEKSIWTQCEGLKAIFEEARRQKPTCSMALNWCFNQPWITAGGHALLTYPNIPKKAYYAVKDALRPVMPSARIEHFSYKCGEDLYAELWMLNDSVESVNDTISVFIEIDNKKQHIIDWETGVVEANTNIQGHKVRIPLPMTNTQKIKLILEGKTGKSVYDLLLRESVLPAIIPHTLNM